MDNSIKNKLKPFGELNEALEARMAEVFTVKTFRKGTVLLKEGQICDTGYHILSGLLRVYYLVDGKEVTSRFAVAGDSCISYWSFYKQAPSFEFIDVVEEVTVSCTPYNELQRIYADFPDFNALMRVGMETCHVKSEERARIIRNPNATERYLKMKELYPQVFEKAKVDHIASFLSMKRETLSRIMSKENRTPEQREKELKDFARAVNMVGLPC